MAGAGVLDTGNYCPQRDGQIAELDDGSFSDPVGTPASAETIRAALPAARR